MQQDYFFVSQPTGEYSTSKIPICVNCGGLTEKAEPFYEDHICGRKDYTLYYLHEGEFSISLDDGPLVPLKPGAFVIIPPNLHFVYCHDDDSPIKIYWAHFTGGYVGKLLEENGVSEKGAICAAPVSPTTAHVFQAFLDEMKGGTDNIQRQRAAATLVLTITSLTQLLSENKRYRRLQKSFAFLQEHFTEQIPKAKLAEMEGLGVSQYNLLFRSITGYTPSQYVTKLRIGLACKLLADATLSVRDVTERCGYDDMFYFSRVFRKECGVSPSKYRRGERKQD